MISKKFKLNSKTILHARPATLITQFVSKFSSELKISKNESSGNLKSILSVLSLSIGSGDEIEISANGTDEIEALAEIEKFFLENEWV